MNPLSHPLLAAHCHKYETPKTFLLNPKNIVVVDGPVIVLDIFSIFWNCF